MLLSKKSDTLLGEFNARHDIKNNIDSDFLIDTNGFSAEGGVAHKRCVIHPCGQAWSSGQSSTTSAGWKPTRGKAPPRPP